MTVSEYADKKLYFPFIVAGIINLSRNHHTAENSTCIFYDFQKTNQFIEVETGFTVSEHINDVLTNEQQEVSTETVVLHRWGVLKDNLD